MEIIEVTKNEFERIIYEPFHIYGTSHFNDLNKFKCESVYYLLFKEDKYRMGIIGGIVNGIFFSPFSAPFGGFSFLNSKIGIDHIDKAIDLLITWGKTKKLKAINLTLPPSIYDESFIAKQTNSLYRKNFSILRIDLNYIFNSDNFNDNYITSLSVNARNKLKNAFKNNLIFQICQSISEKRMAYEIIKQNRKSRGYPLKMSWEQISDTTKIIKADYFLVCNFDNTPIASAIVFYACNFIVQVIYWGDVPEYSHYRTMNFLSYKIFEYYKYKGYKIIDLGTSTENSIPNLGLCDFKESIGCDISLKLSFELSLLV